MRKVARSLVIAAVLLSGAGTIALAQSALTQLGLTEARARQYIIEQIEDNGGMSGPLVDAARKAYAKIPASGRGQVTTAFYAWTKAYVNSPAFKAAYEKLRTDRKPQPTPYSMTVDQELKAKMDKIKTGMEDSLKSQLASVPPAQRATREAELRKEMAEIMGPIADMEKGQRAGIEATRARDKANYDLGMEQWNSGLPADPMVRIARHMREFLDATTDVDFKAKYTTKSGMVGPYDVFDNPAYNKKPWQWQHAYYVGAEALAAGRAAAQAWLKEMGPK